MKLGNRLVAECVHSEPNVFLVDDFLTDNMVKHLVDVAGSLHFAPSFTDDGTKRYVTHDRTSEYCAIAKGQDSTISRLETRAGDVLGFPATNVEPLQIVHYPPGTSFRLHHDAGVVDEDDEENISLVKPRRLATFFAYLNDLPKGRGETHFPRLGLSVTPKRGRAVLFSNVLDDTSPDHRVMHEATNTGEHQKFGSPDPCSSTLT